MGKYDKIINLQHPEPPAAHPRMSIQDRAAQFIGFRALTGHEALLSETARYVDKKIKLTEAQKDILDQKLKFIMECIEEQPEIKVIYFVKDELKDGGRYDSYTGRIKKINLTKNEIVFLDGMVICADDITSIEGNLFKKIEF